MKIEDAKKMVDAAKTLKELCAGSECDECPLKKDYFSDCALFDVDPCNMQLPCDWEDRDAR